MLLYGVLFLLCAMVYQFFTVAHPGSSRTGDAGEEEDEVEQVAPPPQEPWSTVLMRWVPVFALAGVAVFYTRYVQGAQRWAVLHAEGKAKLEAGDLPGARQRFLELSLKGRRPYAMLGLLDLGHCHLLAGEPEKALDCFLAVARDPDHVSKLHPPGTMPFHLSRCQAVLGDLPKARHWLDECRQRRGEAPFDLSLLPEVLLHCREGRFDAVRPLVLSRWREAEASGVLIMKQLRMFTAFALDRLGGAASPPERARALAAIEPFSPGEFDGLAPRWPALRDFLQAHGLSRTAAAEERP